MTSISFLLAANCLYPINIVAFFSFFFCITSSKYGHLWLFKRFKFWMTCISFLSTGYTAFVPLTLVFFSLILFNNLIIKPSWNCKYEHLWRTIYFTFRYIKVWNYILRICFVVASLILLHFFLKLFCTKWWWNWKNGCLRSTTVNSTFGGLNLE